MTEVTWLILAVWVFLVATWLATNKTALGGIGGGLGVVLALALLDDTVLGGFILGVLNIYLIYSAIFQERGR